MVLTSAAFRGNKRLEQAAINNPPLAQGETSHGVALLQAGLMTLGFKMSISTKKYGAPDGIFGPETKNAVMAFQAGHPLTVDGIAGKQTITLLDSLLPVSAPKPPTPPPPPPVKPGPAPSPGSGMPVSSDFKIGTDDPRIRPDPGAGRWNSKPKSILTAAKYVGLVDSLYIAPSLIGDDAAKHMLNYVDNTGATLTIDLEGMIAEVPSAKVRFDTEVERIKIYVQQLPPGTYDVTSTHLWQGYNHQRENRNWYFAVGGYSVWTKGRATIAGTGRGRDCRLELEYKFYDRYNWDGRKSVHIGGIDLIQFPGIQITDEAMGEFHREGMAKEYDMIGSVRRILRWKAP